MPAEQDDLFAPGVWRPALEKYAAVTRLAVHVYDVQGELAEPRAAANPLASLFEERGYDPGLMEECAQRCLAWATPGEPIVYEGAYGLAVVGTPLVLDDTLVGAAVAGYVLVDFTQVYRMRRLAAESGVSFERVWQVARLLPPVPKDRLLLHGQLLQALGDALLRENRRTRESEHNVATLKLESAAKDEFLAVLSHELRNPLASLSSALEVADMTADAETAARSRAVMRRQTGYLKRLVDDLLQVSRITQRKFQMQASRVELADVVQGAVEDARDFIEQAHHEVLVSLPEDPVRLEADAVRLIQVFNNLLSNASKYTPDGGRIELSAERRPEGVRVAVRDNGVGIPRDKLDTLFEMYAQLDQAPERGYRGLGIGLTLAKALVEMHGGRIEARSEGPGQGSEFVVWLPVAADEASQPSNEAGVGAPATSGREERRHAGARDSSHRRVLVVEDNPDVADSLSALLEVMGYETRIAHDGVAGVAAAGEFRPQLVLLDIGLPKLGGYDVARRIRSESWGKHVMLAALTGWGQDCDRDRAQEAGFDRHLTKPVGLEALKSLLDAAAGPAPREPAGEPKLPGSFA